MLFILGIIAFPLYYRIEIITLFLLIVMNIRWLIRNLMFLQIAFNWFHIELFTAACHDIKWYKACITQLLHLIEFQCNTEKQQRQQCQEWQSRKHRSVGTQATRYLPVQIHAVSLIFDFSVTIQKNPKHCRYAIKEQIDGYDNRKYPQHEQHGIWALAVYHTSQILLCHI